MAEEQKLPERPKETEENAEPSEGGEKLSKKALKKLEKEKEKASHTLYISAYTMSNIYTGCKES
jgi:hypothetical protein